MSENKLNIENTDIPWYSTRIPHFCPKCHEFTKISSTFLKENKKIYVEHCVSDDCGYRKEDKPVSVSRRT